MTSPCHPGDREQRPGVETDELKLAELTHLRFIEDHVDAGPVLVLGKLRSDRPNEPPCERGVPDRVSVVRQKFNDLHIAKVAGRPNGGRGFFDQMCPTPFLYARARSRQLGAAPTGISDSKQSTEEVTTAHTRRKLGKGTYLPQIEVAESQFIFKLRSTVSWDMFGMTNVYQDREQTEAKHFILRKYLQKLAFKTLYGGWNSIAYIDGFSGPWKTRTLDYSDSSFMIAIQVLKDVQKNARLTGRQPRIKCFFAEQDPTAYKQLQAAVSPHHNPHNDFFIETFNGEFEDAVAPILRTMANSFALTFIDPTGWTGYKFDKVKPILKHSPGEVLLNFMFDFVNRFTASPDPNTRASFDGILGTNWQERLDTSLPREEALLALFSEQFRKAGQFKHVLSTPIEKVSDRTHFYIVYGTRSRNGLEVYREVEHAALKEHGMRRAVARQAIQETKTGQLGLFGTDDMASMAELTMDAQIAVIRSQAKTWVRQMLPSCPMPFSEVWPQMLDRFMLRKKDAKQICAELGKAGEIKETWRLNGSKRRTPDDGDTIERA
ncbi:three-Cys-motif partner protein TcmP [Ensifer sp.]|uniref:three-Cys-motif partner protein TcmP n=1 Tax=Ensifer sp. TaxID=1872086 RepID=UPI002E0DCBA7|nr:three-Cys-motif partner protein TcmP [Ensifer sp.]